MKHHPPAQMMQKLLTAVLAVGMATSGLPTGTLAATATESPDGAAAASSTETLHWYDNIDGLLAKGSYVEGEAIVTSCSDLDLAKRTDSTEYSADIEILYTSTGQDYELASNQDLPEEALEGADERIGIDDDLITCEDVEVKTLLVTSDTLSTEQLLHLLSEDDRVLDAAPNYIYERSALEDEDGDAASDSADELTGADAGETDGEQASVDSSPVTSFTATKQTEDVTASADGTAYQWAYNSQTTGYKSLFNELSAINLKGWNTAAQNSGGVIAVFDSGVDYTHPDLQGAFFNMTPYLSKTGGGKYGYNALTGKRQDETDPMDSYGHGTHVAGILAAQTNGYGVSGAANGAKLIAVKASTGKQLTTASAIRGYAYLMRVADAGVDLRVVNNSWTPDNYTFDAKVYEAISTLSTKYGVTCVFASGNQGVDIDKTTGRTKDSDPLCVTTVNSIDPTGSRSSFSNYGLYSTDVYAPGSSIISTLSTASGTPRLYLPSAMSNFYFESFEQGASFSVENETGEAVDSAVDATSSFDSDGGCLALSYEAIWSARTKNSYDSAGTRFVFKVPVDESKLDEISEVGCTVNLTGGISNAWVEVLTVNTASGKQAWCSEKGMEKALSATMANSAWGSISADLTKICQSTSNTQIVLNHEADGSAYILAAVCLSKRASDFKSKDVTLRIDTVGLGNQSWSYGFMSGTSMATPAVSGVVAVIAQAMGGTSSVPLSVRSEKVRTVLAKSVLARDALSGLCSTGSSIDASKVSSVLAQDGTVYAGAVSVEVADQEKSIYTIEGSGFGTAAGSVQMLVDDEQTDCEVITWTDTKIELLTSREEGYATSTATVTTADGDAVTTEPICTLDTLTQTTGGQEEKPASEKSDESQNGPIPATGELLVTTVAPVALAAAGLLLVSAGMRRRHRKR